MLLLFGSACGDSVVVARGVSLVSAAVEAGDAGLLGDAGDEQSVPTFESGHGGASGHHAPTAFPPPPTNHPQEPHDGAGGAAGSGGTGGGSSGGGSGSAKHH